MNKPAVRTVATIEKEIFKFKHLLSNSLYNGYIKKIINLKNLIKNKKTPANTKKINKLKAELNVLYNNLQLITPKKLKEIIKNNYIDTLFGSYKIKNFKEFNKEIDKIKMIDTIKRHITETNTRLRNKRNLKKKVDNLIIQNSILTMEGDIEDDRPLEGKDLLNIYALFAHSFDVRLPETLKAFKKHITDNKYELKTCDIQIQYIAVIPVLMSKEEKERQTQIFINERDTGIITDTEFEQKINKLKDKPMGDAELLNYMTPEEIKVLNNYDNFGSIGKQYKYMMNSPVKIRWTKEAVRIPTTPADYMTVDEDGDEELDDEKKKMYDMYINNDFKKLAGLLLGTPFENSAPVEFLYTGFKFAYEIKALGFNKYENTATLYNNLKAFSPISDRKYHELSTASTTTNKICIYETFLYNNNLLNLKHFKDNKQNKEYLYNLLKNEGDDIYNNVINGCLINSLVLLTKKYNNKCLIIFYDKSYKNIKIEKGDITHDIKTNEYKGQPAFLYYKRHVAPYIIEETNEETKTKNKNFVYALRPENLIIKGTIEEDIERRKVKNIIAFTAYNYIDKKGFKQIYYIFLYGIINNVIINVIFEGDTVIDDFLNYINSIITKKNTKKTRPNEAIPDIFLYGFNNANTLNIQIYKKLYDYDMGVKCLFIENTVPFINYHNLYIYDLSKYYNNDLYKLLETFNIEYNKIEYKKFNINEIKENKQHCVDYCLEVNKNIYKISQMHINTCVGEINGRVYDTQYIMSCSSASVKMFKNSFLNYALYESPPAVLNNEKTAYFGGRTEIFKKCNNDNNLYKIDMNSAHAWSMTGDMPFKYYKTVKCGGLLNKDNINDIYLYNITVHYKGDYNNYIPALLQRTKEGNLATADVVDPIWVWGCELKELSKDKNNIIKCVKYHMYEPKDIYSDYINYFYKIKTENKKNDIMYQRNKKMLTHFYGKFAQKECTTTGISSSINEMYAQINGGKLLDFKLSDDKILFKYSTINNNDIGKLSRFSSYISAKTRSKLYETIKQIGDENIYYCSTDSIVCSKLPPADYLSETRLGLWKIEKENIKNAYFISPHVYTLDDENKAKGIKNEKMNIEDFKTLYNGKGYTQKIMTNNKDLIKGIKETEITRTINNSYNKRVFIGDNSNPYKSIKDIL